MIAALYVATNGCYFGLPDVDPWDERRDARLYDGPHPVVAHPPCARWGRFAGERLGQDDGCFKAALDAVRKFGGVLEHPAGSRAFAAHGLSTPRPCMGWQPAGDSIGWVIHVEQGHYGHRARKATWLYAAHVLFTQWIVIGPSKAKIGPRPGRDPKRERRIGAVQRMGRKERRATPVPFRDLLLSIARTARKACCPSCGGAAPDCRYAKEHPSQAGHCEECDLDAARVAIEEARKG
jgi:hypothetical protein